MANFLSSKKRVKQNDASRLRNRANKSEIKTQVRKFTDALRARDAEKATAELCATYKRIDQVAAKGTMHRNAASRRKSRLAHRLNKLVKSLS